MAQQSRFLQASPDKSPHIFSFGVGLVQGNDHRRHELCPCRLCKLELPTFIMMLLVRFQL